MNLFITKSIACASLILFGVAIAGPVDQADAQQGLFARAQTNASCDGQCDDQCDAASAGSCRSNRAACRCQPRCLGRCRRAGGRVFNRNCQTCPQCNEEYCVLKTDCGEESKTCYEIDYKTICIPKVVPPWKKNCQPQCAEARSVKVLKKKSYKCPKCKYTWEVVKPELPQIGEPTQATQTQTAPIFRPSTQNSMYHMQVPQMQNAGAIQHNLPRTPVQMQHRVPTAPVPTHQYYQNRRW